MDPGLADGKMYDPFYTGTGNAASNLVNRLALAASRTQSFMGSPDQSLMKANKRKERKKKKKDAKREAKKQAKLMMASRSKRF